MFIIRSKRNHFTWPLGVCEHGSQSKSYSAAFSEKIQLVWSFNQYSSFSICFSKHSVRLDFTWKIPCSKLAKIDEDLDFHLDLGLSVVWQGHGGMKGTLWSS